MYKTLAVHTLFKNSYIELQNNDVENTANGKHFKHIKLIENSSPTPGCAIICELNGKFLLLKSYRYGVNKECWEIPRGYINPEESLEACAIRELQEETNIDSNCVLSTTILGYIDINSSIIASRVAIIHIKVQNNFDLIIQKEESILDFKWQFIDEIQHSIKIDEITDSFTISSFMLFLLKLT